MRGWVVELPVCKKKQIVCFVPSDCSPSAATVVRDHQQHLSDLFATIHSKYSPFPAVRASEEIAFGCPTLVRQLPLVPGADAYDPILVARLETVNLWIPSGRVSVGPALTLLFLLYILTNRDTPGIFVIARSSPRHTGKIPHVKFSPTRYVTGAGPRNPFHIRT